MAYKIIVITGLPGSGKTTRLHAFDPDRWLTINNIRHGLSPDLRRIYQAILNGTNVGIEDIDFCAKEARDEFSEMLAILGLKVTEWWAFEKNPEQSLKNCLYRNMTEEYSVNQYELAKNIMHHYRLVDHYDPESFANKILPVYKCKNKGRMGTGVVAGEGLFSIEEAKKIRSLLPDFEQLRDCIVPSVL